MCLDFNEHTNLCMRRVDSKTKTFTGRGEAGRGGARRGGARRHETERDAAGRGGSGRGETGRSGAKPHCLHSVPRDELDDCTLGNSVSQTKAIH